MLPVHTKRIFIRLFLIAWWFLLVQNSTMKTRLFIGIALPYSIRKQLAALPWGLDGAKFTTLHNFHLTLAFIGEAEQDAIDSICKAMAQVHETRFPLALKGLDRFDKRILWAGVTSHPHLHALQGKICMALDSIPIEFEHKPFRPHVTLARLKNSIDDAVLDACIGQHSAFKTPAFTVEQFHLFESVSTPEGVQYNPIAHFPLSIT